MQPPASSRVDRRRVAFVAATAGCALVIALLHLPSMRAWFVGDDLEKIWRATADGSSVGGLSHPASYWRLTEQATLRLDERLGGLDPVWFHATNVALHIVVSLLVGLASVHLVRAVRRDPPAGAAWTRRECRTALVAVLAFGTLPSHSEAVVWIAGRGDLLMTLFAVSTVLLHVTTRRERPEDGSPRQALTRSLALGAFVAALLSKESAVAVLGILAVLDVARSTAPTVRGRVTEALRSTWPYMVVMAVWLVVRRLALGSFVGGFGAAVGELSPVDPLRHIATLLARTLLPPAPWWFWMGVAVATAIAVTIAAAGARSWRRSLPTTLGPAAVMAICWFVAVLPVAGLGASLVDPRGERLTYLPSVFAVLVVVQLWSLLDQRRPAAGVAVAAVTLAAMSLLLLGQQQRWIRAGELSERVVRELGVLPRDRPAVLLNAPDTYDGIYVARNAVTPALVLFHGWEDPSTVWQATAQQVTATDEPTAAESTEVRTWRLTIPDDARRRGSEWTELWPRTGDDIEEITVEEESPSAVRVGVSSEVAGAATGDVSSVWWFSGGRLQPAPPPRN